MPWLLLSSLWLQPRAWASWPLLLAEPFPPLAPQLPPTYSFTSDQTAGLANLSPLFCEGRACAGALGVPARVLSLMMCTCFPALEVVGCNLELRTSIPNFGS